MELQKLTKRKIKARRDSNKNALASVCIDLAEYYVDQCKYNDAIAEYEIVADTYKEMGKMLEFASANRGIGECYIKLQEYDKALEYQQIHMGIAKQQKNKLEEQRALATMGHIHLTQYIDHPDKQNKNSLNLASIAFNKSLTICRSLTEVKKYEHKDMIARLLSNLGVVEECKGQYDKGIELLQEAIQICEKYDLFEQLHRGYIALSTLYDRKKVYDEAIHYCNLALSVAERLKNKVTLMHNALLTKSDILIKVGDLHTAKNVLLKAYKLKDPNVSNNEVIEQNLKVVVAMCRAEDALLITERCDYKTKKSLYEKLGDGACYLKNFSCAIEYYHKMLEAAKNNNESGLDLSPCYISLAETYRDNKQYDLAIQYFQEDYNILKDSPRDAVTTMLSIADCLEATKTNFYEIECVYDQALSICKKTNDKHMEYKVLFRYVSMLKAYKKPEKASKYDNDLKNIDCIAYGSETESEGQNTPNIGDDIVISEITDVSDESDSENRTLRKRAKKFRMTRNYKGETQLHAACIKGNLELVKRLLNQGHPVNVRDNCGWLPLHEACIYGRVEIVTLLIENGASVNDRGGMLCQGITPLHDAASNGHLEVIQLLLDNGASSVPKNDNGEIPLHLLKLWYTSQNLDDNQLALYNVIITRLTLDAEKLALPLETSVSNKSAIVKDQEVAYKPKRETPERNRPIRNLRRTVDIDNDNIVTCKNPETPAQSEYQRVMDNLRHPSREEIDKKRKCDESKVSAYVIDDFDDWLDNDMMLSRKKPKTTCSNELINSNTSRQNATNATYTRHSSSSSLNSTIGDKDDKFHDSDTDATVPFHTIDNSDHDKRRNNWCNDNVKKQKKKRQTLLIDSGFTRNRSFSPTRSPIYSHVMSPKKTSSSSSSRYEQNERSSSTCTNMNMDHIFNTEPMLSVDVRITGKLYKVPVPASEIHIRTIKWLADEAANRYSRKECMKPELELETRNGAILANEDLISVLFSAGIANAEEVEARIIKCNLLPLAERYVEACTLENIVPPQELTKLLEETSTTLHLVDLNLKSTYILPLCKVINRQINLTCLILSGNFMRDSCFQVLCTSLSLLENLTELNVSLNQLTFNSVRYLMDVLNHSSEQVLSNLIKLNLSHNPLGNKCLNYLATVTRYLKLRTLVLADVDFTNEIFSNSHTVTNLILDFVTEFDISFNQLSNKEIVTFLSWLQPKNIETLNISNNMHVSEGLIKDLVNWLQVMPVPQLNLRSLYLSRTQATNTEVFELLMLLSFTNSFDVLDLSYNPNLTAVSLRRLMQSSQSLDFLNLIGCNQIFQYFVDCTDSTWSQNQFKQIQLSCNFNEYFTEKSRFVDIWRRVCKNKAVVKEVPHFIKLSVIN